MKSELNDYYKNKTRFQEQNILNIGYGHFESNNEYGIPDLLPTHIEDLENYPLQGFNYALKETHPERLGVHFFLHDYQFERVWNNPLRYAESLKRFKYVLSPDFSPYADLPKVLKAFNIYRNRWCARYWQEQGIIVIPTITWSDEESLQYVLVGIPKHSTIAISTMGEGRWANWKSLRSNWDRVIDTLEPETVLLYGKNIFPNSQPLFSNRKCNPKIVHRSLINSKQRSNGNG